MWEYADIQDKSDRATSQPEPRQMASQATQTVKIETPLTELDKESPTTALHGIASKPAAERHHFPVAGEDDVESPIEDAALEVPVGYRTDVVSTVSKPVEAETILGTSAPREIQHAEEHKEATIPAKNDAQTAGIETRVGGSEGLPSRLGM